MITAPHLPDPACRVWYWRLVESRKTDADRMRDQLRFWSRYADGPSGDLGGWMGGIA